MVTRVQCKKMYIMFLFYVHLLTNTWVFSLFNSSKVIPLEEKSLTNFLIKFSDDLVKLSFFFECYSLTS